jgi:hypothetical protein
MAQTYPVAAASVAVQNGVPCNIGFPTTVGGIQLATPTTLATIFLQSADETAGATNYRAEDSAGNVVISSWMDPHTKATLEILIAGTGIANAIANTTLTGITPGTIISITHCANMPDLVQTNWEVMDSPKISGTNKDAKKLTLSLEQRAGITAVAST